MYLLPIDITVIPNGEINLIQPMPILLRLCTECSTIRARTDSKRFKRFTGS